MLFMEGFFTTRIKNIDQRNNPIETSRLGIGLELLKDEYLSQGCNWKSLHPADDSSVPAF